MLLSDRSAMRVFSVRLPDYTIKSIKRYSADREISAFVREALEEKMERERAGQKEFNRLLKQFEKINFIDFRLELSGVSSDTIKIKEELAKQNQILKLLLIRVSKSLELSNALTNEYDTNSLLDDIEARCKEEIEEFKI